MIGARLLKALFSNMFLDPVHSDATVLKVCDFERELPARPSALERERSRSSRERPTARDKQQPVLHGWRVGELLSFDFQVAMHSTRGRGLSGAIRLFFMV